ncbi:MAG: hypothetical protein GDA52_10140 [Rhodobacteraceae bacterium]|nr:hypothetical protein [Paracoccaceae bacterium]
MNDIKSFAVALFVLIGLPTIASACPDYSAYGAEYSYTGDQLYQPRSFSVIAGGSNNLRNCPVREDGYVTTPPDFTFSLRDMGNYRLEIEVESDCDAILLVNSADGSWFYDDDSRGNLDPVINLRGSWHLDGYVDVWVGTFDGEYCDATLEIETWDN